MQTTITIDEGLLVQAQSMSGLHEIGPLVRAALQALIYRTGSLRLAELRSAQPYLGDTLFRRDFDL